MCSFRAAIYSHTCTCSHLTCIKRSPVACLVIKHFIWIESLLRGHLSYQVTLSLSQRWLLNTGLIMLIHYLVFHSFDFTWTWWWLIQKRTVYTTFHIYVLTTITGMISLLVDYWFQIVSSGQYSDFRHWYNWLDIYYIDIYSS